VPHATPGYGRISQHKQNPYCPLGSPIPSCRRAAGATGTSLYRATLSEAPRRKQPTRRRARRAQALVPPKTGVLTRWLAGAVNLTSPAPNLRVLQAKLSLTR